jgi:hypothetical protein
VKIADYHKRRRALEMSGALVMPPNREKADEDHELRVVSDPTMPRDTAMLVSRDGQFAALTNIGTTETQSKETANAHEEHEVRPEDVQGLRSREERTEGQGEGRSTGEEGAAGEVADGPIEGRYRMYGFFVGPELTDDAWKDIRKKLGDEDA